MPSRIPSPAILVAGLLVATAPAAPALSAQQSFATPEAAVRALLDAAGADSLAGIESILGKGVLDRLPPAEREAHERRKATARRLAAERILLRFDDAGKRRATILIGPNNFPFPVPLVRKRDQWVYDTDAGLAEVARRQVGENEVRAIDSCRAFAAAQADYVRRDWDGDRVLEYARRIGSQDGMHDGLYWLESIAGVPGTLANQAFAAAETGSANGRFVPSAGYAFKVLTAQGEHAPGGARSYLAGADMTLGYGILAYPVVYGETGVFTFMMNQNGIVYEKDLGPGSAGQAAAVAAFDPDPSWRTVE